MNLCMFTFGNNHQIILVIVQMVPINVVNFFLCCKCVSDLSPR